VNYGDVSASYTGNPLFPVTMYVVENGGYEPLCSTPDGCNTANACLVEETYNGFCSPYGYNWTDQNTQCGIASGLSDPGPVAKVFPTGTSPLVWNDCSGLFCGCGNPTGCPFGWGDHGDSYGYMVELVDDNLVRTERACFAWSCEPNCCTDGSAGCVAVPCNPDVPPDSAFGPHFP
jgi:hypothetical protein